MKRTVFGAMLMVFGALMFVTATTLFAVSAQGNDEYAASSAVVTETAKTESKVYAGNYYLNGDTEKDLITLTENEIIFSDGTAEKYAFTVWKDMPETDEASGYINYVDYCFLKIGNEKISYDPAAKEIIFDNVVYGMVN
ncbi:MAG: hypothetical protein HFE79_04095 [Ruminiclostridium sp.]|nr:hypothetical protein [Ruminiclostridium sp.]